MKERTTPSRVKVESERVGEADEFVVRWERPENGGHPIGQYRVAIRRVSITSRAYLKVTGTFFEGRLRF